MGLAPLMLTCVALVGRVKFLTWEDENRNKASCTFPPRSFLLIFLLSLTGLIIGIVGTDRALDNAATTDDVHINGLMKGALALFLAGYGLMLWGFLSVVFDIIRHPAKRSALGTELRILVIVGFASPFLSVRLLYGGLGDFSGSPIYSSINGNNTIYLCMGILMEIFTISICLCAAFLVHMPKEG
ncbi:MAG: hypothetical protein M1818_004934 [Claussenomyces sp. TS43310]|nr:MAG: hypothetical protein M1818_004934 [Claussenomyces sp. TS43310]